MREKTIPISSSQNIYYAALQSTMPLYLHLDSREVTAWQMRLRVMYRDSKNK